MESSPAIPSDYYFFSSSLRQVQVFWSLNQKKVARCEANVACLQWPAVAEVFAAFH